MNLRQCLFVQLDSEAWRGGGTSPLNAVVVGLITLNVFLLILETEPSVRESYGSVLTWMELTFLALFGLEYLTRVWVAGERPRYQGLSGRLRYMVRPYPIIDLLAILPGVVSLGGVDSSAFRALRILRIIRYARFGGFSVAVDLVVEVFLSRKFELLVSLLLIVILVLGGATGIYLMEGATQPETFGSVPRALWWSVVTITTVGYGDTVPVTPGGKIVAAFLTLLGIAAVAIPTGILAAAFTDVVQRRKERRAEAPEQRKG